MADRYSVPIGWPAAQARTAGEGFALPRRSSETTLVSSRNIAAPGQASSAGRDWTFIRGGSNSMPSPPAIPSITASREGSPWPAMR